jgi:hypothetical protein
MAKRVSSVPVGVKGGGWISFAALMIMLSGAFNIVIGIAAISRANQIQNDLLFGNLDGWGWFILIWGVLEILAGLAILNGRTWGILAGILFAFVGCITHLMFETAHPAASVTIIALDVLVIYALCVYGFENRDPLH